MGFIKTKEQQVIIRVALLVPFFIVIIGIVVKIYVGALAATLYWGLVGAIFILGVVYGLLWFKKKFIDGDNKGSIPNPNNPTNRVF